MFKTNLFNIIYHSCKLIYDLFIQFRAETNELKSKKNLYSITK